ncbi:hypothetical protein FGO68_gene11010 [Halteria grandinella]|uniref:Uncharacterized protein n=1 Tax=Halteria grandinella TaxID=5974 RepID=A0A8J8P238_HALGN|nr:hypothetical protein FGO68_gene11010 [Halteria grandinella]
MYRFFRSLNNNFILVAVCSMVLCLSSITLLTTLKMGTIIQRQFNGIVAGFFFSQMADLTESIASHFQDVLHLVENDVVMQKNLWEYTQQHLHPHFVKENSKVRLYEGADYYNPSNSHKPEQDTTIMDWYIYPFKNGSTPYYTTTQAQQVEINSCFNTFYFMNTFAVNGHILGAKDDTYYGFENQVFCQTPSYNSTAFRNFRREATSTYCYCDEMGNCLYSPICRGWYMNQKKKQQEITFEDMYQYAGDSIYGLTICAPLMSYQKEFKGATCIDVVPTLTDNSVGNYIQDMYFAQSLDTNYVLVDNIDIVSQCGDQQNYSGPPIGMQLHFSQSWG